MFGVSPNMRVKAAKLIRGSAAECQPEKRVVWIENSKLGEKLFGFASGFRKTEKRVIVHEWTRHGRDELDDRLMRNPNRIFSDASAQKLCSRRLLLGKPWIEPVDQDIGINQCRHEYRVSRASTCVLQRLFAVMPNPARLRAVVVCE